MIITKPLSFYFKFLILLLLTSTGCSKNIDDPLIVPPKFLELPDPKNPEEKIDKSPEEINKLRELLIEEG